VLQVQRVESDSATAVVLPDRATKVRIGLRRLLTVRDDGQGRYYQFQGYAPRRYDTYAFVCAIAERAAVLSVPEWHPSRRLQLPLRLLPPEARVIGACVRLRCNLAASSAARLEPADIALSTDPGPTILHRPGRRPPSLT
jgi:hypothetical protein